MIKLLNKWIMRIERFWNIIYYFLDQAGNKIKYYFLKFTGIFLLYNLPIVKKSEKRGIKDGDLVTDLIREIHEEQGGRMAYALIFLILFFFLMGLLLIYVALINNQPTSSTIFAIEEFLVFAIIFWLEYKLISQKNKYKKYFKEFDEKPHQWKVKWAWISFIAILFPFVFVFMVIFLTR